MKINNVALIILLIMGKMSIAQEKTIEERRIKLVGLETGLAIYNFGSQEYDFIRPDMQNISVYDNPIGFDVSSHLLHYHYGVNFELRSKNLRIAYFTGIRISQIDSYLGNSPWYNENDVYYIRSFSDENTTEYLKVKEIGQSAHYIGIPIAFRYSPVKDFLFRFYFKGAIDLNFKVDNKWKVDFVDNSMEKYSEDVIRNFSDPDSFFAKVNFIAGWKIGRDDKPNFSVEGVLPSLFISDYSTGIADPDMGVGVNFLFQIPF